MAGQNESILERIAAGDSGAVADCMDAYGGLVWSLARRWSSDPADAEDATQEIFLELWKSAHRYRASLGSEAVFIATIARRRLIDRMRQRERRPATDSIDADTAPELPDHGADLGPVAAEAALARRALEQLKPEQQEIVLLGVVQGLTHSEIAEATGKPLGTVKTQMRRGLIRVRELMEQGAPGVGEERTR